jgi:hypothetical protein
MAGWQDGRREATEQGSLSLLLPYGRKGFLRKADKERQKQGVSKGYKKKVKSFTIFYKKKN